MSVRTAKETKAVLLVDDERENLMSYEEVLDDMAYQVFAKTNAGDALALLAADIPVDLIITDYRMPGMNGIEFIAALRKLRPFVPVVMITAYGSTEIYLHAVSLGVLEYMHKPIRKEAFEQLVRHALHEI
jgi:DNA-binding NtrC family response regulator